MLNVKDTASWLGLHAVQISPKYPFSLRGAADYLDKVPASLLDERKLLEVTIIKVRGHIRKEITRDYSRGTSDLSQRPNKLATTSDEKVLAPVFEAINELRRAILSKQAGLCAYCGEPPCDERPVTRWELDNIIPVPFAHTGDARQRLAFLRCSLLAGTVCLACPQCNFKKGCAESAGQRMLEVIAGGAYEWQYKECEIAPPRLAPWSQLSVRPGRPTMREKELSALYMGKAATLLQSANLRVAKTCTHDTFAYAVWHVSKLRTLYFGCDECAEKTGESINVLVVYKKRSPSGSYYRKLNALKQTPNQPTERTQA